MATGQDGINSTTPQFSENAYEIPSWQIPWNKPWYQWLEDPSKKKDTQTYNYVNKNKGHELNCKCSRCEEELDSAFTPQSNNSTSFLHFPSKSEEEEEEEVLTENDSTRKKAETSNDTFTPTSSHSSNINNSNTAATSSRNVSGPEKVILLSDLEEVRPTSNTNSNVSNPTSETREGNNPSGSSSGNVFGTDGLSSFSADNLMNGFGALSAIQSISDRSKAIQEKVERFRPEVDDGRECVILRGLLVSCLAEIQRVNSAEIEWLRVAKNMVKTAVEEMLVKLEEKIRNNPNCQADNY